MQVLWDFLKYGVPTTAAIAGGLLASQKGWKTAPVIGAAAAGWGAGWLAQYLVSRAIEPSIEELPTMSMPTGAVMRDVRAPSADQVMKKVASRGAVGGFYKPTLRGKNGQPKQTGVVIDMATRQVTEMKQDTPAPTPMGTSGFDPGGSYGSQGSE